MKTKTKIFIAEVARGGVNWRLNLTEGIDFSIYLLGAFEPITVAACARLIKPGDTVLDIGANIGALALPMARMAGPSGKVYCFEPTDYAFKKLTANLGPEPRSGRPRGDLLDHAHRQSAGGGRADLFQLAP